MKKKKIFLGLAIAGISLVSLAACNPSQSGIPTGSTTTEQAPTTTTTEQAPTTTTTEQAPTTTTTTQVAPTTTTTEQAPTTTTTEQAPTTTTTEQAPTTTTTTEQEVKVVKMNGTEYETIADAIADVPTSNDTSTYVITISKGTYEENGLAYNGTATIHLKGETDTAYGADVVIKGHGSDMTQEKTRSLLAIQGSGNIILENLTLESDWTRTKAGGNNAQAEVLGTDTTGKTVAYNCSFKSNQDTLRTAGKAWFYGCYISGDVDFIWMEQAGSVALYEKCEIVSVYDSTASSHNSYVAAPRMGKSKKVGKGLVIFNSTITETDEAQANEQKTYLARNPWSNETTYYNQVAYIDTNISNVENTIWYNNQTETEFEKTAIGYKMDAATAETLGYAGNNDILDATTKANEYSGRETILNRVFNTGKIKFEKDLLDYWDIAAFIQEQGWVVEEDTSTSSLEGEVIVTPTIYKFDGTEDVSSMVSGFSEHSSKSYTGAADATITIPVTGKCYVEVYGFYSGTVEAKANTQGAAVMFFNNGSTSKEIENDYIVYDENATEVVLTVKNTAYITKVVVSEDASIVKSDVSEITLKQSTTNHCVGVALTLSAKVNPGTASNKSIVWSSSDPTVGTIDTYTGKVVFKKAGEVTFTATSLENSAITASITCNPIEPKWVEAEWYTTDNKDIKAEDGAKEIGVFDTGNSAYKSLGNTKYTFTNLSGQTIETQNGLKQNSAGDLSFSTTKGNAVLTVITVSTINEKATPSVKDDNGTAATVLTTVENADGTITYTYSIDTAGTWHITRGNAVKECNPILYAKVVYDLTISKNTFVTYKGGTYSAKNTDAVKLNHNSSSASMISDLTDKVTLDNISYEGVKQNSSDNNWLVFKDGSSIKFTAKKACVLYLYFYNGNNNAVVKLDGNAVSTETSSEGATQNTAYAYEISAGGVVEITGTGSNYLGALEVEFPTLV